MKKPLIVASVVCACAFAANASFNSWFTGINTGATTANNLNASSGEWTLPTAHGDFEVNNDVLEFDLDEGSAVTYDVDATVAPDSNTVTKVTVSGVFTPVKVSELPSASVLNGNTRNAQVAFVVGDNNGVTNFYAWVGKTNGATEPENWIVLSNGSVPAGANPSASKTLVVEFDYSHRNGNTNYAVFSVDGYTLSNNGVISNELTSAASTNRCIAGISCYGSGSLAAVDGDVELGVASVLPSGIKYASLADAAAVAQSGNTIDVLNSTDEDVTLPAGITLADANGLATGTLTANGAVTVAVKDSEVGNGASGEYTLNLNMAGSGTITAALVGDANQNKEVASTEKVSNTLSNTLKVTVQTKAAILTGVKPDQTSGNTDVALVPAAKVGQFRAFIASDAELNAIDVAANVSTAGIQSELQDNGDNGLAKWKSYALGLKTTESFAVVSDPAGDTETAKIKLAIPAATNAWVNGSSYTVSYKVDDTAAAALEISSLPTQGTGANHTIKAVLTPPAE